MSAANHSAPGAAAKRPPCSIDAPVGGTAKHGSKRAPASVAAPHVGRDLDRLMQRVLGDIRATLGLASGLHELFALRLAEAEQQLVLLGKSTSGDGTDYYRQRNHTADLRTWVGVLAALKERADYAESAADSAAERIGYAVRRRGVQ
jgi:hypothetical protein